MKKYLILIITLFVFVPKAFGADFSIVPPQTIVAGENFEILVSANTDGELVNTFGASVSFNDEMLDFLGYKNIDTIIKMWVEAPNEKKGSVAFSGIVPGGVSELYDANKQGINPIPLVRLMFKAKKDGNANFGFSNTQILKNDGKGTPLFHTANNADIFIQKNPKGVLDDKNIYDETIPDVFDISFVESSFFSRTPSMILFNTSDSISGIKYYEVKVGFEGWKKAESPYPVHRGILSKEVTVRAYDFQGNFREAYTLIPAVIPLKYLIFILLIIVFLGVWLYKLLKYRV